jgi:DNA uptake protein ComE-like DNA-binding protein
MNYLRIGLLALALLVVACGGGGDSYDSSVEDDAAPMDAVSTQGGELLDANTATEQALQESTSDAIAAHMVAHRPFASLGELYSTLAAEIGEEAAEETLKAVFIPVELNSASDEDILAIPGVGSRMLHEFKEYRPYESMAQFERDIGKYVDDEELARLVDYVTL